MVIDMMTPISEKTIERLILYRRILLGMQSTGAISLYSHQMAQLAGITPAQFRRDLMAIGYSGTPTRGYHIQELIKSLGEFIDATEEQSVILVGLGHLGRAIVDYFQGRRPNLKITAAFDNDPQKVNRVIHGCRCYHIDELESIISQHHVVAAILTVPAEEAQEIATRLVNAGIRGLLNYSPLKLHLPPDVYVENRDMILAVEKVAYFGRKSLKNGKGNHNEQLS